MVNEVNEEASEETPKQEAPPQIEEASPKIEEEREEAKPKAKPKKLARSVKVIEWSIVLTVIKRCCQKH